MKEILREINSMENQVLKIKKMKIFIHLKENMMKVKEKGNVK